MEPKYPGCEVALTGVDGNAFAIIGAVSGALRSHLRDHDFPTDEIERDLSAFRTEAMSGDYDNVLATAMRWVEVV